MNEAANCGDLLGRLAVRIDAALDFMAAVVTCEDLAFVTFPVVRVRPSPSGRHDLAALRAGATIVCTEGA
jgi:hypothetical protein